ncbi:hypothetical protein TTHERM_000442049 (macronuclear) [Tetrahymena thermophila SB210]|uniref:Uncharacterized protein n=1 Tax=Tetrahymena thermophila (strain SB210) TaxID=312017 RepID=W7XC13_TETTS|nr:hypothetical protein TTHERM_000442049 [Tetrahymena thermophila SB210]EWS73993.1 hypothetical protein TTHERM_000442049 [Tetrahymena thermophila SB210]|eukprot:XP_012653455.1 hypothetical protein TTHERM_000442049 [Tetrahymena thermophila SB210]
MIIINQFSYSEIIHITAKQIVSRFNLKKIEELVQANQLKIFNVEATYQIRQQNRGLCVSNKVQQIKQLQQQTLKVYTLKQTKLAYNITNI